MTFDPFGDSDTRGYLRNTRGLKDPEAVKLFEHAAFRVNVLKALAALQAAARPLCYQDVLDTHKRLFGKVYPWAGQDREALAPLLAVGKARCYDLFAHPRDALRAVEHALHMASDPVQMRAKPGEILGLLYHGHPLLDGNGRTLMAVHAELCRRAGLRVAWEDVAKGDYLAALTRELEEPGKALDAFLAPHVRRPAVDVAQDAERLRTLPGLGPATGAVAPPEPGPSAVGGILRAMRTPEQAASAQDPPLAPLIERLRAFEARLAEKEEQARETEKKPGLEPGAAPRPGPKP